jgi:hypothetical protein
MAPVDVLVLVPDDAGWPALARQSVHSWSTHVISVEVCSCQSLMCRSVSAVALVPRMAVFGGSVQALLLYPNVSYCQAKNACWSIHGHPETQDHAAVCISIEHDTYEIPTTTHRGRENRRLVLASRKSSFANCYCGMCLDGYSVFRVSMTRSLRDQQATVRFRLDTFALGRPQGRFASPNADLERGWIVLMVARSNRQRSDHKPKWLSSVL